MQVIWEFIKENWLILGVASLLTLTTFRLALKHPKYNWKQILKNPLLIFKLFSTAAEETIDIITDIADIVDDVKDITKETNDKLDSTKEEIKDLKETVKEVIEETKK